VDYEEIYSPIVDATTLRFLISLANVERLQMRLMDVITAYLYGSLDSDIYMKIPEGLKMPKALYVDDLNIIGNLDEIEYAVNLLKNEFEMKDLGMTKFYLGLQIEHLSNGIFVHQSNYTDKILKRFNMDKAHPLSSPMVGRSLDQELDPFCPKEKDEDILGPEIPYLSRSTKQSLTATSSNHAELIALYEASRECIWLRSMIQHIQEECGLESIKGKPTILYEDNAACIAQIKEEYIKGNKTKHISPKNFSTYDLQKDGVIDVCQVRSSDNLADLFIKSLPTKVFELLVKKIGLRRLKDIH
ncbi:transposable element, partial [Tanacetum coccineum]